MPNVPAWPGVCAVILMAATPATASQPPAAGQIKIVSGSAFIVRDGTSIRASVGQMVFQADSLLTGADGKIGITLNDETRVSLGPDSEVRLQRFVYEPADGA